jgi:hypothetical protein
MVVSAVLVAAQALCQSCPAVVEVATFLSSMT